MNSTPDLNLINQDRRIGLFWVSTLRSLFIAAYNLEVSTFKLPTKTSTINIKIQGRPTLNIVHSPS